RFVGLRLFLSLAAAGWSGYAGHVEHAIDLAEALKVRLHSKGWRVINASPVAVVCFQPPPGAPSAAEIVRRVLASGQAWISTTTFEEKPVIRACVTHGATTTKDVDILVAALDTAARS